MLRSPCTTDFYLSPTWVQRTRHGVGVIRVRCISKNKQDTEAVNLLCKIRPSVRSEPYPTTVMSVQAVLGGVSRSELGVTLTHEHFSLDFSKFYKPPLPMHSDKLAEGINIGNLSYVRQYPYSSQLNLNYRGPDMTQVLVDEVKLFASGGGRTIVENTTWGLKRDLDLMEKISKEANINVIAGTGHYLDVVQPDSVKSMPQEQIYNLIKTEMTEGCIDNPKYKCGIVGEVASDWPIREFERRNILATGLVQSELGCPVSFHPGRHADAPVEILRIYSEAGGNLRRAVMSHLDRTLPSKEAILEFSELGSYCQFDLFGTEVSFYQLSPENDMLSDAQRINMIKALIADGKEDKITVSHDIHTRHRLVHYGGHGFAHIPVQVKNHMTYKNVSQENIQKILVENPATWLTGLKE